MRGPPTVHGEVLLLRRPLASTNLLANPAFETWTTTPGAPDSWALDTAATAEVTKETVVVHGGVNACKVRKSAADGNSRLIKQTLTLAAGWHYIEYWMRGDGASGTTIVQVTDDVGASVTKYQKTVSLSSTWTKYSGTFLARAGTHNVRAGLTSGSLFSGEAFLDDFKLYAYDSLEEASHRSVGRRIMALDVRNPQTVGNQEARVRLANEAGRYNEWRQGDFIHVKARPFGAEYAQVFDGFIDDVAFSPGLEHPSIEVALSGWNVLLDLVSIPTETTYEGTAWTTMADNLVTLAMGADWPRTITSDAGTTVKTVIPAGMSLRQALKVCRDGLNQGANKWEVDVNVGADGQRTVRLYKRSATVQRTVRLRDLYVEGTGRRMGGIQEVMNRGKLVGGEYSRTVIDKTGLTRTGMVLLDQTSDRAAYPFVAPDTPLRSVAFYAKRSKFADPPTLLGSVARNSDGKDVVGDGALWFVTPTSSSQVSNPNNATDDDYATFATLTNPNDDAWYDTVVYDLGATPPAVNLVKVGVGGSNVAGATVHGEVMWSDDGAAYTSEYAYDYPQKTTTTDYDIVFHAPAATRTHRYWKIRSKRDSAGTRQGRIHEFDLLVAKNTSTDAAEPYGVQRDEDLTTHGVTNSTVVTTGAVQEVLAAFNFGAPVAAAKFVLKHTESSASSLVNLIVQRSANGSTWTDIAYLPSTTATVEDTAFLEEGSFQHLRVIVDDARTGGSAAFTTTGIHLHLVLQTPFNADDSYNAPLLGDAMVGSEVTWDITSLVTSPGVLEDRAYPTPRLALTVGGAYYFVLAVGGGSTLSYWEIDYGTETGVEDSIVSTDTGATWADIATDAALKVRLGFGTPNLEATVNDTASQATYADLVPGGILQGTFIDLSLTTQDMVDTAAATLVKRRASPVQRIQLAIPGETVTLPGSRITLALDAAEALGLSAATDLDVVETALEFRGEALVLILTCNDHDVGADEVVASTANQRRI